MIFAQEPESRRGRATQEQFEDFFKQSSRRYIAQQRCQLTNRARGFLLQLKSQLGGKARCSQHTYGVFLIACFGVANDTQTTVLQVLHSPRVVMQLKTLKRVVEGVDRKVTTHSVRLHAAVVIVSQHHAMLTSVCFMVAAKSRHFDHFTTKAHMYNLEATPNDARTAKEAPHLFRCGISGHIKVFGAPPQQ